MTLASLLLPLDSYCIESLELSNEQLIIHARTVAESAACPLCRQPSSHVHSRYGRRLQDLPCSGVPVQLIVQVRRFVCEQTRCPRRIFAERLEGLAAAHAQRTRRVNKLLGALALALAAEAATRLIGSLGLCCSADTFLRRARSAVLPAHPTPGVLGVDDWAWRKGKTYGSLLVDLERHTLVDLLPDRRADTFEAWLKAHPGVKLIVRDRSGPFAEGGRGGAPGAQQVADRFHLVHNWQQMLARFCHCQRKHLYRIQTHAEQPLPETAFLPVELRPRRVNVPLQQQQRQMRLELYQQVRKLTATGMSKAEIARTLGIGRATVRLFAKSAQYPEMAPPRRQPSLIDPYVPYLHRRWEEGCHDGLRLWQEIVAQGFSGTNRLVSMLVTYWRKQEQQDREKQAAVPHHVREPLTVPQTAWLLLRTVSWQTSWETETLAQLSERQPEFGQVITFTKRFLKMVRERTGEEE